MPKVYILLLELSALFSLLTLLIRFRTGEEHCIPDRVNLLRETYNTEVTKKSTCILLTESRNREKKHKHSH